VTVPSRFLEQSRKALATATKALRFAVLQDLMEDRKAVKKNRHEVRYRSKLLAVRGDYDPFSPQSIKDSLSADTRLGKLSLWALSGFLPDVYRALIGDVDRLQDEIDTIITPALASYEVKESSPPTLDTLKTFLGLAYHNGVAAVAARPGVDLDGFSKSTLDQIVRRNLVENPAFDVLQIGAPRASATLVGSIVDVLDYAYIAIHGDMAFLLGAWVLDFRLLRFTSDRPQVSIFEPDRTPILEPEPAFPGILPRRPLLPDMEPGRKPLLTVQSTLYRRWEELADGPGALRAVDKEKAKIAISQWLEDKPRASPPLWPLPVHDHAPKDEFERTRMNMGLNANVGVHATLECLKRFLAGSERTQGKGKSPLSFMTFLQDQKETKKLVMLTGGAYPRGGRKPPSVTHDTTYGLDLDIDIPNVEQKSGAEGKEELINMEAWLSLFGNPEADDPFSPTPGVSQLFDHPESFVPAVAFTQGIIATLPSRMLFGDPLVIIAAFGALMERLKALEGPKVVEKLPGLFAAPYQYLFYDPSIHWNHWHVDWVPAEAGQIEEIKDEWAYVATEKKHKAWTVEGEYVAFSSKERDFFRPVPLRYSPPRFCGLVDQIVELNTLLQTGVDLGDDADVPAVSPFPIGPVPDLTTLKEWRGTYFPQWQPKD